MSDWKWLNKARIPRGKSKFGSSPADGFNGVFHFKINNVPLLVMGSEDDQWEHISVSVAGSKSTPSFSQMRQVKELFWGKHVTVMQLYLAGDLATVHYPGCLHLWHPTKGGPNIPIPLSLIKKGRNNPEAK
jgi:hypothetical protein